MNEEQQSSSPENLPVKKKGGQPPKFLTQEDLKQLAILSSTCNQEQIAAAFGMCANTFMEIKKRQPEVLEVYKKGKVRAIHEMGSKLLEAGRSGNVAAIIFYLKTQGDYREKGDSDLDTDNELEYDKNPKRYIEFVDPKDNMKEVKESNSE